MRKNCPLCGAEVFDLRVLYDGKRSVITCDAREIAYRADRRGNALVVTPNGETVECILTGDAADMTGIGYRPHYSTCTVYRSKMEKKEEALNHG